MPQCTARAARRRSEAAATRGPACPAPGMICVGGHLQQLHAPSRRNVQEGSMANVPAWVVLGLLSALFASLVAIFGKLGLQSLDPTAATAARSVVIMAVLVAATLVSGRLSALQSADGLAWTMILLSGLAGAAS